MSPNKPNISNKEAPDVFVISLLASIVMIVLTTAVVTVTMVTQSAGLPLDFNLVWWSYGVGFFVIYSVIVWLAEIALRYIQAYSGLVKFLKKRGLDSFVEDALEK